MAGVIVKGGSPDEETEAAIELINDLRPDSIGSWSPRRPRSDSRLWRYLNFTQLQSILERDKVWFTNVNQFDDPYEGTLPHKNIKEEIDTVVVNTELSRDEAKTIHNIHTSESYIKDGFVNCWNKNDHQSAALWEQYIDSSQGVAICTTFERLNRALDDSDQDFIFGLIEYIDYKDEKIPEGKLPPLYHKRNSFEYEKEFRVSFFESEPDEIRKGVYIDVNTNILIDKLYLSPQSEQWFADLIERVLNTYDVNCDLMKSDLYSNPAY